MDDTVVEHVRTFNHESASQAYEYTMFHGPTFELEGIIASDAQYSCYYAHNILKSRFSKGEKAIAASAHYSYYYACGVLDSRFLRGESVILKDACYISKYARKIMGRRWLKAEPILRKSRYWPYYKNYFNILL